MSDIALKCAQCDSWHIPGDAASKLLELQKERDRLAHDALAILSANEICTPEKGYVAEPYMLALDIKTLARERDSLKAALDVAVKALKYAKENSGHMTVCTKSQIDECYNYCDVHTCAKEALAKIEEMGK